MSENKTEPATSKDDPDSVEGGKKEQKSDDNAESSSTASDGGKGGGSGSGGGYSADCSSSDASSEEAAKAVAPQKELQRLSLSSDNKEEMSKLKESKSGKNSKVSSPTKRGNKISDTKQVLTTKDDGSSQDDRSSQSGALKKAALPQWNGVRILHPMDPRIDLSTVGHIQTSSFPPFPSNVKVVAHDKNSQEEHGSMISTQAVPSIDQYMNLMEVVRPFFHAHGISHGLPRRSDEPSNERPSSDFATDPSDSDQRQANGGQGSMNMSEVSQHPPKAIPSQSQKVHESDSSSMVVLARVKKKHLRSKTADDPTNDGSNNSTNEGSNESSASSSDKRVRIQHPLEEDFKNTEGSPAPEDGSNDVDVENDQPIREADVSDRQESTSASSSDDRNNHEAAQVAPLQFGVPAVVSESYSSSRTGSSGASNNNPMSTSGSGSAGNTGSGTGSGTASGSNQGGSSGSGNDQGGISFNGNGSSGSGNDVKGSSEETMDNSGENNSGENSGGNSDATNSNEQKTKSPATMAAEHSHASSSHRSHVNLNEISQRDLISPTQLPQASNAVREKKLQDKKRKRMNMRREYEEKVQQEMESSEGSRDREENDVIKAGRPVTMDTVLSFTKTPRIVVKATPPFLVVYTNAAYCRLSGIDAHTVVGKPISSLLSMPDPETLAEVAHQRHQLIQEESEVNSGVLPDEKEKEDDHNIAQKEEATETQGLSAAEAAGRARAAASLEDSIERLIATSGFGRWNIINVTAMKPSEAQQLRAREEGSNGSSITSNYDGPYHQVPCSMGVSPVVSSPEAFAIVPDKEQELHHHKTKRRKHHHSEGTAATSLHHQQPRRNFLLREVSIHRKRHLITHYAIQLELLDGGSRKLGSHESQSSMSTTVEANILGLTKSELRRQRIRKSQASGHTETNERPRDTDNDAMESENSGHRDPVSAIG